MEEILFIAKYFLTMFKYISSKQSILKLKKGSLCLGNLSKNFAVNNMKRTKLYTYGYAFPICYDSTDVDDFLYVYNFLMIKRNIN